MKKSSSQFVTKMILAAALLATPLVQGAYSTWSGASGTDLLWSTAGNWSPSGSPGINDTAQFYDDGATNILGSAGIDNKVSANKTIQSLWLSQTNNYHNLQIDAGVTLTVAGTNDNGYGPIGSNPANTTSTNGLSTLFVGTRLTATATTLVKNTISGAGTLVLNNTNNELNVRQGNAAAGVKIAVLDMSGLNTFTANLGRIRVSQGDASPTINRVNGQLWLAATNNITLTGTNSGSRVQLVLADYNQNNNGNGVAQTEFMYLGQKNTLYLDNMLIGGQKGWAQLLFNPAFASPTILLRGHDGVSRLSAIRIGDETDAAASSSGTGGIVNLLNGTSDILADTIIVGKGQTGNGAGGGGMAGTLVLGSGTLDANSLLLASQSINTQAAAVSGTATFSNTTVVVNKLLQLGASAGSAQARNATLNITGGSFTVASNLVTQGTATINVTNAVMQLRARPSVLASIMNLDGGAISNAATLKVTNTLNIVNSGQILGGSPVFDLGNSGTAVWNVSGTPTGGLVVSNVLQGSGTINGNLTQAAGATLNPGGSGAAGTLAVGGNMTLSAGTLKFDLSNSGGSGNDQLSASGTVTLNGTNGVNLSALNGAFDTVNPYTLITSGGLVGGNQTYFTPAGGLGSSRYTFTFTTDSANVYLAVSGVGPANLTWVGDGSANNWNLKNTFNWNNGAAAQFYSLDAVTFNDSGSASPAVNLVGTLNPGSITVSNTTKNYTFSGTGGLTGAGLAKSGTGSLTFNNTGDNTFAGLVTINNGVVTLNNTGLNTFVNGLTTVGGGVTLTGASTNVFSAGTSIAIGVGTTLTLANANANTFNGVPIQLNGALTVTQAVDATIDGAITGAGTITKTGSGALKLAGDNSGLSSVVQINVGTIKAGTTTALGSTGVVITNSATLDLNGFNQGAIPVTVSGFGVGGSGALVNSGGQLNQGAVTTPSGIGLSFVTMTGNTVFGGTGVWNIDVIRNFGCWGIVNGSLSTGGNPYNLTKVGPNEVSLNNSTVDPALANIDVQQGLLDLDYGTSSLGNPTNTITIRAGAEVSFSSTTTPWDKKFILFGDGVTPSLLNWNGANTIIGPVTLNGNCVITAMTSSRGSPVSITLNGPVLGTGSLTKSSVDTMDTLILGATNSYTGNTTVNGGILEIAVASIATNSTVSVADGAVLQLDFAETNVVSGFKTNGVSLPLGVYSAANVAPFIAGSGSLQVVASGPSGPATIAKSYSGGVLSLSWPAGQGWRLQQQTNSLSKGISTNWVYMTDGSVSSTNIPVNSANPTVFYRLTYP